MTSILFVGDLNPRCRSEQRFAGFVGLGHEVVGLSFAPVLTGTLDGPPATLVDKLRHRLGRPADSEGTNKALMDLLERRRFDVLWVEKAPCIRPRTLRAARSSSPGMKLVFNSDDDMYARHNQSHYFRRCLPLYDVVFTAKSYNTNPEELPALGARRTVYVPQAFDADFHRPVPVDPGEAKRLGARVGFVGTFEKERAESMLFLARAGIPVRVWGNGWSRWVDKHPKLLVEGEPIYGEQYIKCLCSTDINLGFLRRANRDLHTSRSLDIPACGGFYLAERTTEHEALFTEGKEAEYFSTQAEMLRKVRHYLEHESDRRQIAHAGRERCLASDYSHSSALSRMLHDAVTES